ncbi:MAG: hypothetical protein AAFQ05_03940 [Pseudomonadota bacterium]
MDNRQEPKSTPAQLDATRTGSKKNARSDAGNTAEVLGLLYEAALDPDTLIDVVDAWDVLVGQMMAEADFENPAILQTPRIREHSARAERILDANERLESIPETWLGAFQNVPAYVVDAKLKVVQTNEAGRAYAEDAGQGPLPLLPEDEAPVLAAVSECIAQSTEASQTAGQTLVVASPRYDRAAVLAVNALRSDGRKKNLAIIALCEVGWPEGLSLRLTEAFGLTDSEIGVVKGLVELGRLSQVASTRKRTINTVRNQLKSVLSKTGTQSQVELIRLVMSFMEVDSAFDDKGSMQTMQSTAELDSAGLATFPFRFVNRPHDRRVSYIVNGIANPLPVLALTTDFATMRSTPTIEQHSRSLGLKMIVPMRPGYGDCSPVPGRRDFDETLLEDALAAVDAQTDGPFAVLCFGADSYYAIRLAHMAPKRVTGIFSVSGTLPFTLKSQISQLPKWGRFLVGVARYTPHLAPFFVKASFALAHRIGPRGVLERVYKDSRADMEMLKREDVVQAMIWSAPLMQPAKKSVQNSFVRLMTDRHRFEWSDMVREVSARIPVRFWNGLADPTCPAPTIEEFRRNFPDVTFHLLPEAGNLLFFDHFQDILGSLAAHCKEP